MAYTRKWIPPVIPIRNDLAVWKALFTDVHASLLLAGLAQTETAGQLVIADVSVLPNDGVYAGFIEYSLNDDLQDEAPVLIRLEFGCGSEGLSTSPPTSNTRSRTPNIRGTVFFKGISSRVFTWPQAALNTSASNTSLVVSAGMSYLTNRPDVGFLGVAYGVGSRNNPAPSVYGPYIGATLSLFIQRSLNEAGSPTGEGLAVFSSNLYHNSALGWPRADFPSAYSQYLTEDYASTSRQDLALRLGGLSGGVVNGAVQTQQVFYQTPKLTPFPWLVTCVSSDVPAGTEFELEVYPGTSSQFVCLGNETSIGIDPLVGSLASLAMLFEG